MSIDATHTSEQHDADQSRDRAQLLIPPAMLIAAAAMGVASHLHLGVSGELAVAVGITLFCLMLLCHVLLRAADEAERAAEEAAERRMAQVASPLPPAPRAVGRPSIVLPAIPMTAAAPHPPKPVPRSLDAGAGAASLATDIVVTASPADRSLEAPNLAAAARDPTQQPPAVWTFRPVDLRLPTVETGTTDTMAQGTPPLGELRPSFAEHGQAPAGSEARLSAEAGKIDAILTRLAAQIQSGAGARDAQADAALAPHEAASADAASLEALAAQHPETALASAVDALRSTVEAMRGEGESEAAPVPAIVAPTPVELGLAAVVEALAAERADVFLAPILGLADEQARHFEVSVQLRSADGEVLDARALAGGAGNAGGAGLLPLLDALNVRHAASFALRLERHGRDGTVFSEVAGPSLESEQFVSDVAGGHAQGIADRMVLSFAQGEMRGLGPAQLAALGDLGRLGFRFALAAVADLDMDFEALRALGFEFVKLDAQVFLRGLECGGQEVLSSDICRHLDELGLAVIVSGINDDATRERMLGCGVTLGQGLLFGAPRPVPVAAAPRTMAA